MDVPAYNVVGDTGPSEFYIDTDTVITEEASLGFFPGVEEPVDMYQTFTYNGGVTVWMYDGFQTLNPYFEIYNLEFGCL